MKVISISNDRKRAQVIVTEHDQPVTRHAVLMPGTKNKYTIWKRLLPFGRSKGDTLIEIQIKDESNAN